MSIGKKRKKDLGIFYTDERIVDFIFNILLLWKEQEDTRNQRWHFSSGKRKFPSVIDPACGEGGFLKAALKKKFTKPKYVWGIDIDEEAKKKWKAINLLKSFGSEAELENHFIHQNGLLSLPEKRFRYKKRGLEEFDCVVGNPPYGGIGVKLKGEKLSPEIQKLLNTLQKYEIFSYRKFRNLKKDKEDMLFKLSEETTSFPLTEIAKMAEGMPIEVLFIERFIQLTKPGGYIAIIIPDGILANANLNYVRRFISDNTKLEAIVSLPRDAFKNVGTSAKTSILFLRKPKDKSEIKNLDYPVFMAIAKKSINGLKEIFNYFEEVYPVNPKPNVVKDKIVTFDFPDGAVVDIRVDRTARDLIEEMPVGRWDPKYWRPEYDKLFSELNIRLEKLEKFITDIQGGGGGSHFSAYLGDKWDRKGKYAKYLHISALQETGINWVNANYIDKRTYERLRTKQLLKDDLLLSNKGTVGKSVVITKNYGRIVVGDTRVIRLKNLNPYYLCIFFKSKYGLKQNERFKSGVASEGTTVDQLKCFNIVILDDEIQKNIESEYKKMAVYHDKAMKAKSEGDESNYKKNIKIAEKMLKELIAKTEEVIKGKRKDVI